MQKSRRKENCEKRAFKTARGKKEEKRDKKNSPKKVDLIKKAVKVY
jgi:hypothetical protein